MLDARERHLERDFGPQDGDVNPFLHLSLHLAVAEQLTIDQPPGIVAHFERLRPRRGSEHDALHAIVECLGEIIWEAQRLGTPPDHSSIWNALTSVRGGESDARMIYRLAERALETLS